MLSPSPESVGSRRTRETTRKVTKTKFDDPKPEESTPVAPSPPRVRKSEIRPKDTTMSMANQFADVVKRSSSILLKSVAQRHPELREKLNRANSNFFHEFADWMKTAGRRSQRKINEPPPCIPLLEEKKRECASKMDPLMKEVHIWSNSDPMLPEVSEFTVDVDDSSSDDIDDPAIYDIASQFLPICKECSLKTQQDHVKLHELERICEKIEYELTHNIEIDMDKQVRLCQILDS